MDFLKEIFSAGGIYALFLLIFFIFGFANFTFNIFSNKTTKYKRTR